jgi:4'-phosphopantetheinyl transferase EntD
MSEIVRPLFADDVLVAESDPRRASLSALLPAEAARVERAVVKRQHEFAAGRLLARRLFDRLDVPEGFALLNGEDRAPIWPEGVVGTISHTKSWAAVAVAAAGDTVSLGCDLEHDEPLKEGLLRRVCVPREREWIASLPRGQRGQLAMLFFSAKEAAYKAQYPSTRRVLAFSDFAVEFDLAGDTFLAEFQKTVEPYRRGRSLRGRWRIADGLIATAVTIRREDLLGTREEPATEICRSETQ